MKHTIWLAVLAISLLQACTQSETKPDTQVDSLVGGADKIVLSFAFMGCNRMDYRDLKNQYTDASSANIAALTRIFEEMSSMSRKPDLFFFLGDMVNGEDKLSVVDGQLAAWVSDFNNGKFGSKIKNSGIEVVAIPGNHEFLTRVNGGEYPLKGAIDVWLKRMAPFLPSDRIALSSDSVDQASFALKRGNVGFVLMNTDTYNPPTSSAPYGTEGVIPYDSIVQQIAAFRADNSIQHIFVLGHKPAYVQGGFGSNHMHLPDGQKMWPVLQTNKVAAMLSAHAHWYEREQPMGSGTYQVIAGNGGSWAPKFYGYTVVNVWQSGNLELVSKGFDADKTCYAAPTSGLVYTVDSTFLTWGKNANPYTGSTGQLQNYPCTH